MSIQQRVLVLDACHASEFTEAIADDLRLYLSIAAVGVDELGWKGLWEEELPIVGGVFMHYFRPGRLGTSSAPRQAERWGEWPAAEYPNAGPNSAVCDAPALEGWKRLTSKQHLPGANVH